MQQARGPILLSLVVALVAFAPSFAERAATSKDDVSVSPLVPSRWQSHVEQEIEASEYNVTWQTSTALENLASAWHANTRGQGFRTYFTPDGFHVIPRSPDTPEWSWSFTLRAYGRGALSRPVKQARLFPNANRIELDRGQVVEWLVNQPHGLKHGFVLHGPPDAGGRAIAGDEAVYLDFAVTGTLTPALGEDGRSVRFFGASGIGVLYYRDLEVRDATGRDLPARMETRIASGNWTVRLLFEDAGAVYPVEIDPLVTTASWVAELDRPDSAMGFSVDTAGDVNGDGYDDVIVGARRYDNGFTNEGAAFLYLGSDAGPAATYDWMVEGGESSAAVGCSVGTAGDVNGDGYDDVVVGAWGVDNGQGAWVFHGSPSGLAAEPDWRGQGIPGSIYGRKVASAGDVNGDGYDDVVVADIGYGDSYNPPSQDGAAYVYHGSASGLLLGASWFNRGNQMNAIYGLGIGSAGDVNGDGYDDVVVGANQFDNGELDEGQAYLYLGSAAGLSFDPDWTFENNVVGACLGATVGTAGDVNGDGYDDVIVGSAFQQCWNIPTSPLGRAHVFHGSPDGLPTTPNWIAEMTQTGSGFASQAAWAGDVNGDGYDDVIIGANHYSNDQADEGAAFLYLGSETGLTLDDAWMVEGNQSDSRFGYDPSRAGDVNGDGFDDVILGAWRYENGEEDEGAAFLYLGTGGVVPAGAVPADTPLILDVPSVSHGLATLELTWGASCLAGDTDYEVYEGELGDFTSHSPRFCTTGGQTSISFLVPSGGARYYLVVPRSRSGEGSYGTTSGGVERGPGAPACLVQAIGSCE